MIFKRRDPAHLAYIIDQMLYTSYDYQMIANSVQHAHWEISALYYKNLIRSVMTAGQS